MNTDKRRVIREIESDNSKRSNENDSEDENEERIVGGGVTLPLTLTHSLQFTLNTLLIVYLPLIVFTISQNI